MWCLVSRSMSHFISCGVVFLFHAVQHERMKFLCIGTKLGVEVFAWAQKPYSKFMGFKVRVITLSGHVCNGYVHGTHSRPTCVHVS